MEEGIERQMVMDGDLTWDAEPTIQGTEDVL